MNCAVQVLAGYNLYEAKSLWSGIFLGVFTISKLPVSLLPVLFTWH